MCEFIKPKKLAFDKEISKSTKTQIKPLLPKEVDQPEILNNEFSKPYVSPVQIKTEYQNSEKVKIDFVRATRRWLQSSVVTTTLLALNLHTKLTLKMLRNGSLNVERPSLFKVLFKGF